MAVKPILFSAPMVRALFAGRKTQTRRALALGCIGRNLELPPEKLEARYQPGDTLWVRESWRVGGQHDKIKPSLLTPEPVGYGADEPADTISRAGKLRPSMFMPRWASRLTLVVTETRVQRLQEISEADAHAEGVEAIDGAFDEVAFAARAQKLGMMCEDGRTWFAWLWDSLNSKRPRCAWADNPWVAAYTFTVHHENIDAYLARVEKYAA